MTKIQKERLKTIKSHKFPHGEYRIIWRKPRKGKNVGNMDGFCTSPEMPNKTICINPNLDDLALMTTAIDEGIHSGLFQIDNDHVEIMSNSIASFLYKMGYRLS